MAQSDKQYFKDFFNEKESINDEFVIVDKRGVTHVFEKEQVLVEILALSKTNQKKVRNKFVQIDFGNGDINHFIKYMLRGMLN